MARIVSLDETIAALEEILNTSQQGEWIKTAAPRGSGRSLRSLVEQRLKASVSVATLRRAVRALQQGGKCEARPRLGVRATAGGPDTHVRGNKSRTIGLVTAEIADLFVGRVITGISAACDEQGFRLLLADSRLSGIL